MDRPSLLVLWRMVLLVVSRIRIRLSYLIGHAKIGLQGDTCIIIHFDGRGPRTLCLIGDIDLSFAYLDRSGVLGTGSFRFVVCDRREPLWGAIGGVLLMTFCNSHTLVISHRHCRVVTHFALMSQFGHVNYFVLGVSSVLHWLWWLSQMLFLIVSLTQIVLPINHANAALLLWCHIIIFRLMRKLTIVGKNDSIFKCLVHNRLDRLALSFFFITVGAHYNDRVIQVWIGLLAFLICTHGQTPLLIRCYYDRLVQIGLTAPWAWVYDVNGGIVLLCIILGSLITPIHTHIEGLAQIDLQMTCYLLFVGGTS